jgi:hypothetical protein
MPDSPREELEKQAALPRRGLIREFGSFLMHSKKWWLTPIVVVLLLLGLLVFLAGSPAAPFIYTLF